MTRGLRRSVAGHLLKPPAILGPGPPGRRSFHPFTPSPASRASVVEPSTTRPTLILPPAFTMPATFAVRPSTLRHTVSDSLLGSSSFRPHSMPECWGHRGASGAFPENTIASFVAAVRDGADAVETDIHATRDGVLVMFHDSVLGRTTNGSGAIAQQDYHGGIEHVRTVEEPVQKIPTFNELCDFLMLPENHHVKANIDIKPDNQPDRLFHLMKGVVSQHENFETLLAPRLILGLWHPRFIAPAQEHVPDLRRTHIGGSPLRARKFFWDGCDGFSMSFASLVGAEGQKLLRDAQAADKDVFVWTVNRPDEMIEATNWGVKAVLTDNTDLFQRLRTEMAEDFDRVHARDVHPLFRWTSWQYYGLPQYVIQSLWHADAEKRAGETFEAADERARSTRSSRSSRSSTPSETETAIGTPESKAVDAGNAVEPVPLAA